MTLTDKYIKGEIMALVELHADSESVAKQIAGWGADEIAEFLDFLADAIGNPEGLVAQLDEEGCEISLGTLKFLKLLVDYSTDIQHGGL
jgi:hypothetical protein